MALLGLAIDMMLPAFSDMREAFGLEPNSTEISRIITVFFLGLSVAQLAWGPVTDRFGRRPVLVAGMTIYAIGALGSALSPSLGWILFFRFIWGIGAAASRVMATAVIRDSYQGPALARAMSITTAVFLLVPIMAPSIGTVIITLFNWRAVFWFCLAFVALMSVWSARLTETLAPEHVKPLHWRSITGNYAEILRTRVSMLYTLATVFVQGTMLSWLASSELLISNTFDRKAQFPFIFGAVAFLLALAVLLNAFVVGRVGVLRVLQVTFIADIAAATAAVVLALATDGRPDFWHFMPLLAFSLSCHMVVNPNLASLALEPLGHVAGSASSVSGAARTAGGAVLGAIVDSQMSGGTVTPLAIAFLVGATLAGLTTYVAAREPTLPLRG